jgi:tetratricopeptide (TPR) repeat protein
MKVSFKKILGFASVILFILVAVNVRISAAAEMPQSADSVQVDADSFKKEIERLKNEKEFEAKRVEEMRQEREQFVKEIRRVESLNSKYTKEIEEMRAKSEVQEQAFDERMKKLESRIKETSDTRQKLAEHASSAGSVPAASIDVEKKANDVLMKGGDLDPEDEKFKEELARAHYNMGNVYFERGEYQRSVVEYYQAVDLMPYDADAHYNLAFVSGEYVGDQETALKHYQWYLYLKPKAEDRKLIEEKIATAKIALRGRLSTSKVEKSELTGQMNIAR